MKENKETDEVSVSNDKYIHKKELNFFPCNKMHAANEKRRKSEECNKGTTWGFGQH